MATSRWRRARQALASREHERKLRIKRRSQQIKHVIPDLSDNDTLTLAALMDVHPSSITLPVVAERTELTPSQAAHSLTILINKKFATSEREFPRTIYRYSR